MKRRSITALTLAVALFAPAVASATQWGIQSLRTWKSADQCTASAYRQFPDYTPEANAKRDAALRQCLASGLLAPRDPLSPPAPAK